MQAVPTIEPSSPSARMTSVVCWLREMARVGGGIGEAIPVPCGVMDEQRSLVSGVLRRDQIECRLHRRHSPECSNARQVLNPL